MSREPIKLFENALSYGVYIMYISMQASCWCPSEEHKYDGYKIAEEVE